MKRSKELKICAENYILSTKIDEYINTLEKELTNIIDKEKRIKISKYIEWAKEKSEWINPIIQKEDKVLGKKYDDTLYDIEYKMMRIIYVYMIRNSLLFNNICNYNY